jgi:DNA mismatch repair protein MutL
VVERPLSVVKELTENAIDAGASVVTAEIRDGGLGLIRVTDNGSGIPAAELPLAFARHATSKIASPDDLFDVRTLGFRGEALCSIAAVAQVEILTKTADAVMGSRAEVHGGSLISNQPVGCTGGTTLIVSNLFYNIPARRKFLKKPATEAGYVSDLMQRLALSHPGISFRYINNGQLVLQTGGNGDLKTAMLQVYGRDTAAKLALVEASDGLLSLNGYIGKPEISRANRLYGNFFINGRYIQSRLLQQAVEAAMKTMLPGGRFPVYALGLRIPPDRVDVNVHPTKMDVRFEDEERIAAFVRDAVYGALTDSNLIPEVKIGKKAKAEKIEPDYEAQGLEEETGARSAFLPQAKIMKRPEETGAVLSVREESFPPLPVKAPFFHDYVIHGLLFSTYWLVSQGESLFLVDQHAAHERVVYEGIKRKLNQSAIHSQTLLEPVPFRLTPRETALLRDNLPLFSSFGFELTGNEAFTLTAVPFILKGPLPVVLLTDLLDKLEEADRSPSPHTEKERAIAVMACKAAVKANDLLTEPEARALIQEMLALDNPFTCPHGRPTAIEISKREIERKFKRV